MIKNCKNCDHEFITRRSSKQHCSGSCFKLYRLRPEVLKKTKERRIKSNLIKYGVDNPSKNKEIQEKAKETCLKRYGVISPSQNSKIRQKQIDTCMLLYGVSNPQQNKELQDRQKLSLYNNYGVTIPLKNKDILDKLKKTNIKRYGVDNISKTESCKNKIIETNLRKYNVRFISQHEEFKQKQIKSRLRTNYKFLISSQKFINIIPLFTEDEYCGNISYHTQYSFKCKICNSIFNDTLTSGNIPRCFKCNPICRTQSESEVFNFLKISLPNEDIISNDRTILHGKELDIYIPSLKLAIEYDGLFWHSELGGKKYKNYHLNKTIECEKMGIRLIHIFEDEWLYNKELVQRKLLHIINKNSKEKIYARKCNIEVIPANICNIFLDKNHIQGCDKSSIRLGAYYKNELISVMTFGPLRIATGYKSKKDYWEMYRFCTLSEKSVVGIGGKLASYFIKKYDPEYIISYADVRWSTNMYNNLYKILNFSFIKQTAPNYWYLEKNCNKRIHRFNFQKHILKKIFPSFNPKLTEWQNMQLNGYDRIWDCGCLKYEWKNDKVHDIY